jgi:excisionase family DNA binding protein
MQPVVAFNDPNREAAHVKRARPALDPDALEETGALLTTGDVARLLRVHPKHVYRLLRRGLPGHRVGGEWRFSSDEVRRWSGLAGGDQTRSHAGRSGDATGARVPPDAAPPPLLAANGDLAVECLLGNLRQSDGPILGFVQADRGEALDLLDRGDVLCAGYHGDPAPACLDGRDERLAFIHLVDRDLGVVARRGAKPRSLHGIERLRVASRPRTAGVRAPFDAELQRQGIDPAAVEGRATVFRSHKDVVCAVARGDADVGIASIAWAHRVGLEWLPLCRERYGLILRAAQLGDPRIVRLCEVAQGAAFRRDLAAICGYQARSTGTISYVARPSRTRRIRQPSQGEP